MAATPDPAEVFIGYRPHRRRWLGVLAVVVALLVALGGVQLVRATVTSPESVVSAYFEALADRDPDAALRLLAPGPAGVTGPAGAPELATAAMLAAPAYLPPADLTIGEVRAGARTAEVTVSYEVDRRTLEAVLRLERVGGWTDRVFHRWRIRNGFGTLALGGLPAEILVNGLPVAAYDGDAARRLPALPGGYLVGVGPDDPVWAERSVRYRMAPDREVAVDLTLSPRPRVRAAVDAQVVALLDRCAGSSALEPPGCPFGYRSQVTLDEVTWRIARYPRLAVSAAPGGGGLVLAVGTVEEGEAVLTGVRPLGGPLSVAVAIRVEATAELHEDTVILHLGP